MRPNHKIILAFKGRCRTTPTGAALGPSPTHWRAGLPCFLVGGEYKLYSNKSPSLFTNLIDIMYMNGTVQLLDD